MKKCSVRVSEGMPGDQRKFGACTCGMQLPPMQIV